MAKLCSGNSNALSSSCGSNGSVGALCHYQPMLDEFMNLDEFPPYIISEGLELFDENYQLPTIESDVARMSADDDLYFNLSFEDEVSVKREIRNGDCMWSAGYSSSSIAAALPSNSNGHTHHHGVGVGHGNGMASNSSSAASSYSETGALPPASVCIKREPLDEEQQQQQQQQQHHQGPIMVNVTTLIGPDTTKRSGNNGSTQTRRPFSTRMVHRIKQEPYDADDDFEQQQKYNKSHNSNLIQQQQQQSEQLIPPGGSLLRRSQSSSAATKERNNNSSKLLMNSGSFMRPDTPHSQYDEVATASLTPTQSRHCVDLGACVMGSNNISLTAGPGLEAKYIDHLTRELQNTSKEHIDLPFRNSGAPPPQLSEVLDLIYQTSSAVCDTSCISNGSAGSVDRIADNSSLLHHPHESANASDCDSDDGESSLIGGSCASSGCESAASMDGYMRHISDHSYTRNEMVHDAPNHLETPSDSDEEIDVVSLNEKKLPTNPSDQDRRALQTQVADKFSNRTVQNKKGVRTISPRRRGFYQLPYTPASSSPVKSVANSRYPSPSSTPYQTTSSYSPVSSQSSDSGASCSSNSNSSHTMTDSIFASAASAKAVGSTASLSLNNPGFLRQNGYSQKRYEPSDSNSHEHPIQSQSKKYRSKKYGSLYDNVSVVSGNDNGNGNSSVSSNSSSSSSNRRSSSNSHSSSSGVLKRQYSVDEADTIEKRNLHNDMERQRRIGLKNLFEALKKQIPSIKDKERAPKVNILREAARLCEHLAREEHEMNVQKQKLKEKIKHRQELFARMRLRASNNAAAE